MLWLTVLVVLWPCCSTLVSSEVLCPSVMKIFTGRTAAPGSFLNIKARVRNTATSPQMTWMSLELPRGFKFMDAKPNDEEITVVDNVDGGQTVYWIDMILKRSRTLNIKAYVLPCLSPGSYDLAGSTFQTGSRTCLTRAPNRSVCANPRLDRDDCAQYTYRRNPNPHT